MTVTDPAFGDYEEDDAFDLAGPDALQVAIKLQKLRRAADLPRRIDRNDWDDLNDDDREKLIQVVVLLLAWGRRQGWVRGD